MSFLRGLIFSQYIYTVLSFTIRNLLYEKMIHGCVAHLLNHFAFSDILTYFQNPEKGQHTEIIHVLSLLLAAS